MLGIFARGRDADYKPSGEYLAATDEIRGRMPPEARTWELPQTLISYSCLYHLNELAVSPV